jgi:hypothetical protein
VGHGCPRVPGPRRLLDADLPKWRAAAVAPGWATARVDGDPGAAGGRRVRSRAPVLDSRRQDRPRRVRRVRRAAIRSLPAKALVVLGALAVAVGLAACGSSAARPQTTLAAFLTAWSRGDWTAMRAQVADPPGDFTAVNAQVFSALGIRRATFQAGALQTTRATSTARSRRAPARRTQ